MKFAACLLAVVFVCAVSCVYAQPPYWSDIQNFKKQDSIHPPKQHAILFIGSSSFTKWVDVQSYFPAYPIINRGFGGSTLVDVIHYVPDIVYPYNPKQVVIYCGENDIAYSDTVTPPTVLQRFKTLFGLIRNKWYNENIVFVSIKPSPSRVNIQTKVIAANALIKQFLASQPNAAFVDVYNPMLAKDGKPMPDIFVGDNLHMNAKGYAIWKKVMEPYLAK